MVLGLVVAVLVVLAFGIPRLGGDGPLGGEAPPFPQGSEFPTTTVHDHDALGAAGRAFVETAGWQPDLPTGWDIGVAVLTQDDKRVGVRGNLQFGSDVAADNTGFVRCGERFEWTGRTSGLHVTIMDGRAEPYDVLPSRDDAPVGPAC